METPLAAVKAGKRRVVSQYDMALPACGDGMAAPAPLKYH